MSGASFFDRPRAPGKASTTKPANKSEDSAPNPEQFLLPIRPPHLGEARGEDLINDPLNRARRSSVKLPKIAS